MVKIGLTPEQFKEEINKAMEYAEKMIRSRVTYDLKEEDKKWYYDNLIYDLMKMECK